jgi:ABC-2 type transport system ATP-binding protein
LIPIEVSGLKKYYGDIKAVDGISFTVNEGEVFGLLGPNGAGKTTTIEILEGLRKKDSGTAKVLGIDPWVNGGELHRRIGVIPQQFTFFEKQNPRESINYYANLFNVKWTLTKSSVKFCWKIPLRTCSRTFRVGKSRRWGSRFRW